jgi:hypothetical protein
MSEVIQLGSPGDLLVSHAGISPFIPLEEQLALRNYEDLRRYLIENHLDAGDSFLWVRDAFYHSSPDLWQGYLVVHGHTPVLKLKRFVLANGKSDFHFVDNDVCIRQEKSSGKVLSVNIDSGSAISGRLTGLGLFMEKEKSGNSEIRMRSLTVSREEIFPRDLGLVTFGI